MSSKNRKPKSGLVASVAIALVAATGGCDPTVPGGGSGPASNVVVTSGIRECPHTWMWEARDSVDSATTIEQEMTSVTRGAHHVPEYNDCQKFVVEEAGQSVYTAGQFAIFAAQDSGLIAALNDGAPVAVAVIFAEQAYAPLGIERNFNCLVLHGSGDDWSAAMYPPNNRGIADCSGEFPEGGGHPLAVTPPAVPLPARQGHYAQLARWGYDLYNELYYMTVTCGEAVCHVGPVSGFEVASTPTPPTGSASTMIQRVHEVPTWHDQQRLAALPSGPGSLQPTNVWGTVIPAPDLGQRNALADFRDRWVTVAEVEISTDHSDYTAKGFLGTADGNRNIVQSCVIEETTSAGGGVTRSRCPDLPADFLPGGKCDATDDASTGQRWRSRHIAVDGAIEYFCVKRYPLTVPGLDVPAAARWRWRADDEMLWYRCMQGCCDEQV
ncbi:MAG: hypothetical protein ACODAB_04585 [Gemmatimonadota bacterium]